VKNSNLNLKVNPIASMMAIQNPELNGIANEVTDKLQKDISRLQL
jgi:hypothetical protein